MHLNKFDCTWSGSVYSEHAPRGTTCLNPSDQDASVLGKRVHGGSPRMLEDDVTPVPIEEDEDKDDVGPMPMPADPSSVGGVREKRKGSFVAANRREVAYQNPLVLPTRNCNWGISLQRIAISGASCTGTR